VTLADEQGYWTTDPTKLNPKFGTPADLKDLSNALHSRGMFLMVDVAVNHAAAASSDTSNAALERAAGGKLLFKKSENYHPKCEMNYGPSETKQMLEQCWFQIGEEGKNDISLMDLKTESAGVADVLNEWVGGFTKEYGIDGLRLDASKHMDLAFQHNLCKAAGVFCAGEVVGEDVGWVDSPTII
jgi:alpha-amylase